MRFIGAGRRALTSKHIRDGMKCALNCSIHETLHYTTVHPKPHRIALSQCLYELKAKEKYPFSVWETIIKYTFYGLSSHSITQGAITLFLAVFVIFGLL